MLSATDNELMTRVGAGTPMGNLLREYWIPFLFSWEIEANGSPERVRLLGENLLAVRDSSGRPGLIAEQCPHRGASLYFGRNEENGLRCIYHGWKFDVAGRCVDMPSEPPDSNFQWKVRTVAYPVVERAGMIWTYMGPKDEPPPLPALEWLDLPEDHIVASKRVQYSNWVQGMEGDLDQSHVSFVHSRLNLDPNSPRAGVDAIRHYDTHPRFQVVETDYGVCIGSGRKAPNDERYWRISQHLMPFHTMTGPYGNNPTRNWRAWVPIDDENVFVIGVTFHPTRPFTGEQRENLLTKAGVWNISPEHRAPVSSAPFGRWRPALSIENDFHQDREMQKFETFSGIAEFWAQDAAPQLSMGKIFDRTQEHLGTSDLGIISMRRRLIRTARAFAETGETPREVLEPEVYAIRSDAVLIPAEEPWFDHTAERRKVAAGNPDCPA